MRLKLLFAVLLSTLLLFAPRLWAHEVSPVVGDFRINGNQFSLDLRMNVEAFVAGINLDGLADTNLSDGSDRYDELRAMTSAELAPLVREFAVGWLDTLQVEAGAPVPLAFEGARIPVVGDVELPRVSHMLITGELPQNAFGLSLHWPERSGALVLRQQGVEAPYTGYLTGGETSPVIPITGGAALSPWETFVAYIPVGFDHILPKGLDHILFVLGLFFLSPRLGPLIWQISAFTLAHTVSLALGTLGLVEVPPEIVEPLIAASIVFVALENVFVRRLHPWRPIIVFGFGLLHGLGFASVLGEFGLPPNQLLPALVGFNVGVELGQLTVIAIAFATVGFWFRKYPWYRGRIAIPASIIIALVGIYWFAERTVLA